MRLGKVFGTKARGASSDVPRIGGVKRYFWQRRYKRGYPGDWATRNLPLCEIGLDVRNKSILDAGCNLGIVGYELSKQGPAFYHGIDKDRDALEIALAIFSGVEVDHRFDRVDLSSEKQLSNALEPSYDIVLFLRVLHILLHRRGETGARRALEELAAHCSDQFVATALDSEMTLLVDTITGAGFVVEREYPRGSRPSSWLIFKRRP